MQEQFSRTKLIYKEDGMNKLKNSSVIVFGVGGVGGYVIEALARVGIGHITIVDKDRVSVSNINRQIIALNSTIGRYKCDVMEERIKDINSNCIVDKRNCFYLPENKDEFDFSLYDYVIDCVDTVTAKISIILEAYKAGSMVISAMGAGNKVNPSMLRVSDIYKTKVDPLARVMRTELKKRNIKKLKVVYSEEYPIKYDDNEKVIDPITSKVTPGSTSFVPSSMGLLIASEVVKDILKK
jgi:tRNA A37 threonylcarbamoyladenosine dehydratase